MHSEDFQHVVSEKLTGLNLIMGFWMLKLEFSMNSLIRANPSPQEPLKTKKDNYEEEQPFIVNDVLKCRFI